jgi:hypothetical protein
VIEPAPPYRGEGPHALWHVSEDPGIERFVPHHRPLHANDEPLVYAIDTRYLGGDRTRRVHVVESAWLDRMRTTPVFAYRMPEATFEPWDRFFVSRETVEPVECAPLGDLVALHADARIELRFAPALYPLWDSVAASTLDFSGIRLRNATLSA